MKRVCAVHGKPIVLGRRGEHQTTEILFDLTPFIDLYGTGNATLVVQRPGDADPYPVALTLDGNAAIWTVTNTDTAVAGIAGKCELFYYAGEKLAKSEVYQTHILAALGDPSDTPPDPPGKSWFEKIIANVLPARRDKSGQYWAETDKLFLGEEGHGAMQATTSSMSMQARRSRTDAYRGLYLRNAEKADLKECLRLRDEEGNYYYLFGQHNKPTPGEIGALPAVPDDDKDGVWITRANTLRMGSTGENYNDDAEGELGKGEFAVTGSHIGMSVRKDSTDSTRRYFRLYDSNAYPNKGGAVQLIDEDGESYALYGEHNPVIEHLWENGAPGRSFVPQTLKADLWGGSKLISTDIVKIEFNASVEGGGRTVCTFRPGDSTPASVPGLGRLNERIVTVNSDRINFGSGRYYDSYGSTSRVNDNTLAIPLRIWRERFVVSPNPVKVADGDLVAAEEVQE